MSCPTCKSNFPGWDVIGVARVEFTPRMAARYIGPVNSEETINRYADVMRSGRWNPTIAPLRIWRNGLMMNGYTRMLAVVRAGVPVEFDVQIVHEAIQIDRDASGEIVLSRTMHHTMMLTEDQVRSFLEEGMEASGEAAALSAQ